MGRPDEPDGPFDSVSADRTYFNEMIAIALFGFIGMTS
jgi:hypothetical protein